MLFDNRVTHTPDVLDSLLRGKKDCYASGLISSIPGFVPDQDLKARREKNAKLLERTLMGREVESLRDREGHLRGPVLAIPMKGKAGLRQAINLPPLRGKGPNSLMVTIGWDLSRVRTNLPQRRQS